MSDAASRSDLNRFDMAGVDTAQNARHAHSVQPGKFRRGIRHAAVVVAGYDFNCFVVHDELLNRREGMRE
jgi:hypothetical protein